jgi:ATP-dependent Lon protease
MLHTAATVTISTIILPTITLHHDLVPGEKRSDALFLEHWTKKTQFDSAEVDHSFFVLLMEGVKGVGLYSKASSIKELSKGKYRMTFTAMSRVNLVDVDVAGGVCTFEHTVFEGKLLEKDYGKLIKHAEALNFVQNGVKDIPGMSLKHDLLVLGYFSYRLSYHSVAISKYSHKIIKMSASQARDILEAGKIHVWIKTIFDLLSQSLLAVEVEEETEKAVTAQTKEIQKNAIIREKIKALQKQLSDEDDSDGIDFESRVMEADHLTNEARTALMKHVRRLKAMQQTSSEYSSLTQYVDTLLSLPWNRSSQATPLSIVDARLALEQQHYGMDQTKKRILEYLAVCALTPRMSPPILCLVGPPGTGKSTIAQSIAQALGRVFERISLGGAHDENEIRGHRRTYVGAMPGRIVKSLIKAGVNNPVLLLDEIDKVGTGRHSGGAQAALLEVLDPSQYHTFHDYYVDIPVNLSTSVMIATANDLSTISPPLRDRMEIIEVPSYTSVEKLEIVKRHLYPQSLDRHGLTPADIEIDADRIWPQVISDYTAEAGVRSLSKKIDAVVRHSALFKLEHKKPFEVSLASLDDVLGLPISSHDRIKSSPSIGLVTGLAWTPVGGDILFIEAARVQGGPPGEIKITGSLGDVMRESVQAAWTYLRTLPDLIIPPDISIHVHVPAGATPKDGPSAGIALMAALLSVITGHLIPADLAMTGEITIRGDVLAVGGIREKLIAAHRSGVRTVIMPTTCKPHMREVPRIVQDDLTVHYVSHASDVITLLGLVIPLRQSITTP